MMEERFTFASEILVRFFVASVVKFAVRCVLPSPISLPWWREVDAAMLPARHFFPRSGQSGYYLDNAMLAGPAFRVPGTPT